MSFVHGCDCSIVIKNSHFAFDVPCVSETVREDVSLLFEEAAIEGDGTVKAIRKSDGAVGVVVTALTIDTVPLLLSLAFGFAEESIFVSETRNMYKHGLRLVLLEDTDTFDLIQTRRVNERVLFEGCRVSSFELRVEREQSIKLRLDITGDKSPINYIGLEIIPHECGERFYGENVTYTIKDISTGSMSKECKNIYGVTIICKKDNSVKTEIWIKRVLENGSDIPLLIDEMIITARLLRDKYEDRQYGTFSITLRNLVLISDETNIESFDVVVGQLRYFVNGSVSADVFSSGEIML